MDKRPISDLRRALDIIDRLEDTTALHDRLISSLIDRVEAIERRLEQDSGAKP